MIKDIAYAVSGDKGENVNIGVIAYNEKDYAILKEKLTEKTVADHFSVGKVIRYELPNLWALNFILESVLEGGLRDLRTDSQGKTFGQKILEIKL